MMCCLQYVFFQRHKNNIHMSLISYRSSNGLSHLPGTLMMCPNPWLINTLHYNLFISSNAERGCNDCVAVSNSSAHWTVCVSLCLLSAHDIYQRWASPCSSVWEEIIPNLTQIVFFSPVANNNVDTSFCNYMGLFCFVLFVCLFCFFNYCFFINQYALKV